MRRQRTVGEERGRHVTYHLDAITEIGQRVRGLTRQLERALGKDVAKTARSLSFLEVEVFHTLAYHVKQLRGPLLRLRASAREALENQEGELTEEELVAWFNKEVADGVKELRARKLRRRGAAKSARAREGTRGKKAPTL